jgi:hypothetical protein
VPRLMKMRAQQIAGLPCRLRRRVEVMFHRGLRRIKLATCTRNFAALSFCNRAITSVQKNREEKFASSSRVEVGIMTPEKFGVVRKR